MRLEGKIKKESETEVAHSNSHADHGDANGQANDMHSSKRKRISEEHQDTNGLGGGDGEDQLHTSRYPRLVFLCVLFYLKKIVCMCVCPRLI